MNKTPPTDPVEANQAVTVCYRHPDIETGLRCNRCGKPICAKCAVRTPVGFRCPDCVREQQDKFYTGGNLDYAVAVVIALPLSLVAAGVFTFIIGNVGFFSWFISFIAAPVVGGMIAETVRWAVRRRRSRYLRRGPWCRSRRCSRFQLRPRWIRAARCATTCRGRSKKPRRT